VAFPENRQESDPNRPIPWRFTPGRLTSPALAVWLAAVTIRWEEDSGCADTIFIGVDEHCVRAIAPPGRSVSPCLDRKLDIDPVWCGWRLAVWDRKSTGEWPIVDSDLPSVVCNIDVIEALSLLDRELHESVWACLWNQLQIARQFGRPGHGHTPPAESRRLGERATAGLNAELKLAFPNR
jgi:hypothetical protein